MACAGITRNVLLPEGGCAYRDYASYLRAVGGNAVLKARGMGEKPLLEELARSGLRGRGGAGFATAAKWSTIAGHPCPTRSVVCNAAEGEPGTFKDRFLIRKNPFAILEGALIAADVVGARDVYVVTKRSFRRELERLQQAAAEMTEAGIWGYHELHLVEGPEEYLTGEEKALLEVIEGNDPLPREAHYPPYERGLFATPDSQNPAIVNNAETLAHVAVIARGGAAAFRENGTDDTPGTLLFTLSGDVHKPGVYEAPAGITLRQLFDDVGGGPRRGLPFKCALPGVSASAIPAEKFDGVADFGGLRALGSGLGSAGFVVLDAGASIPRAAQAIARFLFVESCNQCAACKRGLEKASNALDDLLGRDPPSTDDVEAILMGARSAPQGNRCYLPVQGSVVVPGLVERFRLEFEAVLARSPDRADAFPIPKMVDFDEDTRTFTYDQRQGYKRPNWTYEPGPA